MNDQNQQETVSEYGTMPEGEKNVHFLSTGPGFPYAYYVGILTALKVYGNAIDVSIKEGMTMLIKLADNSNSLELSVRKGSKRRFRSKHTAADGTAYLYQWSEKRRWVVGFYSISKPDYLQIVSWWQSATELDFYPDLENAPTQSHNVTIVNEDRPLSVDWLILQQADRKEDDDE